MTTTYTLFILIATSFHPIATFATLDACWSYQRLIFNHVAICLVQEPQP